MPRRGKGLAGSLRCTAVSPEESFKPCPKIATNVWLRHPEYGHIVWALCPEHIKGFSPHPHKDRKFPTKIKYLLKAVKYEFGNKTSYTEQLFRGYQMRKK